MNSDEINRSKYSFIKVSPLSSAIIDVYSFRLKSAQCTVMKDVGKPHCFTWRRLHTGTFCVMLVFL